MGEIIHAGPKKYPETSIPEVEAVNTFNHIVDHRFVKAYINKMDKIPNYDGYLELTNDDQYPIGKIDVQIKKLADEDLHEPKYQCDVGFLSYCEDSLTPVFLIGVDIKNSLAYWAFIGREFLARLRLKDGHKSISIKFSKENIIRKDNNDYFPRWKKIIKDYKTKLFSYDSIKRELEEKNVAYQMLTEKSEPAFGIRKAEFIAIHHFLDYLNAELDTNFKIIKDVFFQSCWKVGIAYSDFTNNRISYILYHIPPDKNDVQIKYITPKLKNRLMHQGLTFTSQYAENIIRDRPKDYALEIIYKKIKEIIERKALPIHNNVIAREFLFDFIDKFHVPLGLEFKNKYSLGELKFSFYRYLPIWVEESLKGGNIRSGYQRFTDPSLILIQMSEPIRGQVAERIKKRLSKKQYCQKRLTLGNNKYPFWLFTDFLMYLETTGISEIERIYIPRDYGRVKGKSAFIWSFFAPEDVKKNIQVLFRELPSAYDSLLEDYFPTLKPRLCFFDDFDRLIIVIDVKEEYKDWKDSPKIDYYYLKNKEHRESKIDVYLKTDKDVPIDRSAKFDTDIKINGEVYRLRRTTISILDFIFHELPMLNCIYKLLDERFHLYFKK